MFKMSVRNFHWKSNHNKFSEITKTPSSFHYPPGEGGSFTRMSVLFCHGHTRPTYSPFPWIFLGNINFGIFENYFLEAQTISFTQLHLPPTGSNAKYDGHWYIEPTIPVPGFRKQLTNFLQENGCGNTPTSRQCGSPSAWIRTWKLMIFQSG